MKNDIHDLGLVLDSRVRLIVIESWDELRVLETLTGLAVRRGLSLYMWSITEGVRRLGFGGEPQGEVFILPLADQLPLGVHTVEMGPLRGDGGEIIGFRVHEPPF